MTHWISLFLKDDRIIDGVQVGPVNLSNLSKAEAYNKLAAFQNNIVDKHVLLKYKEKTWVFVLGNDICQIDLGKTIEGAWKIGRKGFFWQQYFIRKQIKKKGYKISFVIHINQIALDRQLQTFKKTIDRKAIPARIIGIDKQTPVIIKEIAGYRLDILNLKRQLIHTLFQERSREIILPVIIEKPKLTYQVIVKNHFTVIGSFSTEFDSKITERSHNIALAVKSVDGTILLPGETFSFNKTVGNRVSDRGYLQANIMLHGLLTPGIGGGVCQVATTLYSATLFARLKIIERKNHERLISYVPPGQDATVLYGIIDLKFQNNRPSPIVIYCNITQNQLNITIWGQDIYPGEEIQFIPVVNEVIDYNTIEISDPNLNIGDHITDRVGEDGYEIILYRKILKNGLKIKKELINCSRYEPLTELVRTGKEHNN
jgi:Uncharacterized vancomycin resistance protein